MINYLPEMNLIAKIFSFLFRLRIKLKRKNRKNLHQTEMDTNTKITINSLIEQLIHLTEEDCTIKKENTGEIIDILFKIVDLCKKIPISEPGFREINYTENTGDNIEGQTTMGFNMPLNQGEGADIVEFADNETYIARIGKYKIIHYENNIVFEYFMSNEIGSQYRIDYNEEYRPTAFLICTPEIKTFHNHTFVDYEEWYCIAEFKYK